MTPIPADFDGLLLAGYAPLSASGFALPCYGSRPRPNAWHAAACSIDGDHRGTVVGFGPYFADGIVPLPDRLHRQVAVGAPWVDVFLWDGRPHVGTPAELLDVLQAALGKVAAAVPISLLDLALAASDEDVRDLAEGAREHVERLHGAATAERWRRDLLTAQARLAVRRQIVASAVPGPVARLARMVRVDTRRDGLTLVLPEALSSALGEAGGLDPLRTRLRRLGDRVGARPDGGQTRVVFAASPDPGLAGVDTAGPEAVDEDSPLAGTEGMAGAEAGGETLRVLVVFSGTRSRAIARHLAAPDWVPVGEGGTSAGDWVVRRGRDVWDRPDGGASVLDVLPGDALPASLEGYDVVAWLLDDGTATDPLWSEMVDRDGGVGGRRGRAIHLLAPALLLNEPSRMLADLAVGGTFPLAFDCVLDTSLARSPFWTGNPWRAVDRRMADVVIGSALVCATGRRLRDLLSSDAKLRSGSRRRYDAPRIFSIATGRRLDEMRVRETGLLSELSSTGLPEHRDVGVSFGFGVVPLQKSARPLEIGWASLRPAEVDFPAFAAAVLAEAGSPRTGGDRERASARRQADVPLPHLDPVPVPGEVKRTLRTPDFAAALRRRRRPAIVLTAETPTLKTVRAALAAEVAVVRYTDRDTLAELLAARSEDVFRSLPRELRLPKLGRLPRNRGLATRGVDPRDVVKLPVDGSAWRDLRREAGVADVARGYVTRVGDAAVEEVALPRNALARLASEGASLPDGLSGPGSSSAVHSKLKRPADLRVAWSDRPVGSRRFVVEDGVLPVRMMVLPLGTVPAQRMFIVDGDAAVPMLLNSRLFAVWARATTSRSTSWLSRFSVTGTFETLPIPGGIDVRRGRDGQVSLAIADEYEEDPRFARLGAFIDSARDGDFDGPLGREGGSAGRDADFWREVDEALLEAIGLPPEVSDVDLLERLVEMNRSASRDGEP